MHDCMLAGAWDVSRATSLEAMFAQAENFTGSGIWSWDVGRVTTLHYTFWGARRFVGGALHQSKHELAASLCVPVRRPHDCVIA